MSIQYTNQKKLNTKTWEKKCEEGDCYIGRTSSLEACKLIKSLRKENTNKVNLQPNKQAMAFYQGTYTT